MFEHSESTDMHVTGLLKHLGEKQQYTKSEQIKIRLLLTLSEKTKL